MLDLEKVLKALEWCKNKTCDDKWPDVVCPYSKWSGEYETSYCECTERLADDALALLKAQEPVKAIADGEDSYMCNNCGTVIGWAEWEPGGIEEVKYKFCPECGRAVKWE